MAEQSVPDSVPTEALDAAVDAVRGAGYPITIEQANALLVGVRAAMPILVAAGRAQAAADIRGELENCPNLQIWDAGAGHIVDYCARLAEGISHTECLDGEEAP